MPYKAKGKCVYKADTSKKVGCTKGPVSKYLAALHANVPDAKNEAVNTSKKLEVNFPEKLVNKLAKDSEDWMNYVDLDLPSEITASDFEEFVINDPQGNPKIKKMWNSLSPSQKNKLYNLVVDVLEKQEGSDDLFESVNLSEIAKKFIQKELTK